MTAIERQTLITGGAGGMGRACARRFACLGDQVTICDISIEILAQAQEELNKEGVQVKTLLCDFSDDVSVQAMVAAWDVKRPIAIVHTAGLSPTMSDWRTIVNVNLTGTARLLDAVLPHVQAGSSCVCIASNSGYLLPDIPAVAELMEHPRDPQLLEKLAVLTEVGEWNSGVGYAISKRAVRRLVATRAMQWGQRGARINSLSPGMMDTPMGKLEYANQPFMAEMLKMTPVGRIADPDEMASAAQFLCSEDASFVAGIDLLVDGGCVASMDML